MTFDLSLLFSAMHLIITQRPRDSVRVGGGGGREEEKTINYTHMSYSNFNTIVVWKKLYHAVIMI